MTISVISYVERKHSFTVSENYYNSTCYLYTWDFHHLLKSHEGAFLEVTGQNSSSHTVPVPPTVHDQSVFQVDPSLTAVSQKTRRDPKIIAEFEYKVPTQT